MFHTRGFQHIVEFFTVHSDVRRNAFIFLSVSSCDEFEQVVSDCENKSLPDKEFRYLRTVIVPAAVHQGLDSKLALLLVTFWHWASDAPYTSPYSFA